MKLLPAIFFVAVGIWVAYTYPDLAQKTFVYIQYAIEWVKGLLRS